MKSLKFIVVAAATLSLGAISLTSSAASDGLLGPTSTGTTDINIVIPPLVKISDLSDITATTTDFENVPATGNTGACIYSNHSSTAGEYDITATSGNGGAGAFTAASGANNLTYTATWTDNSTTTALTSGTPLTNQKGADTSQINCGGPGNPNAHFAVSFATADMLAAPLGTYTDTVSLKVDPV